MAVAAFNMFDQLVEDLAKGVHNLSTDTFTVALCAAANAPVAGNSVLADLTQIDYTNLSTRDLPAGSAEQTAGVLNFIRNDLTLTASGGAVAAFRYVVFYNSTAPGGPLICWYDYGSDYAMADADQFIIDLNIIDGIFGLALAA